MVIEFKKRNFLKSNPIRTICFSFLAIIAIGTIFLYLPISSNKGLSISFLDCLFTSTSATCVTGFSAQDTFFQWSTFGKIVILILIQTGGLGLITFSSIFLLILNNKLSLKNMKLASSQINIKNLADTKTTFKTILLITFLCEFVGAALLSISYCKKFGGYGVFMATFASIASYCNAGLDINGIIFKDCSFIPFNQDYLVLFTVNALTFIGGIGFVTINEIISLKKAKIKLKRLSISSKIAIFASFFLVIFGGVIFFILEYNGVLSEFGFFKKIANSLFNSTSARTCGFVSVDFSKISNFTKLFLSILMFIGANPTGTSGGIKISTMFVLISTVFCVIKNKEENTILNHKINKSTTYKSIALFFVSLSIIFLAIFSIWLNNSNLGLSNIIFSVFSAFSTTGFQVINSTNFSSFTKYVLIILMYIGRVGPISFAFMFKIKNSSKKQLFLPDSNLYI